MIPSGVAIPETVGEPEEPPHVLYVGRLSEEKGVRELAEAARGLRSSSSATARCARCSRRRSASSRRPSSGRTTSAPPSSSSRRGARATASSRARRWRTAGPSSRRAVGGLLDAVEDGVTGLLVRAGRRGRSARRARALLGDAELRVRSAAERASASRPVRHGRASRRRRARSTVRRVTERGDAQTGTPAGHAKRASRRSRDIGVVPPSVERVRLGVGRARALRLLAGGCAAPANGVELGVWTGFSFLTFCDAAAASGLDSRCIGIDTWEGDVYAGVLRPESPTSSPLEPTGTATGPARPRHASRGRARGSPAGSIDLLHVDGLQRTRRCGTTSTRARSPIERGVLVLHDSAVTDVTSGSGASWKSSALEHRVFTFARRARAGGRRGRLRPAHAARRRSRSTSGRGTHGRCGRPTPGLAAPSGTKVRTARRRRQLTHALSVRERRRWRAGARDGGRGLLRDVTVPRGRVRGAGGGIGEGTSVPVRAARWLTAAREEDGAGRVVDRDAPASCGDSRTGVGPRAPWPQRPVDD